MEINGTIFSKEYYDRAFEEIEALSDKLGPEEISAEIQKRLNLTFIIGKETPRELINDFSLFRLRIPKPSENFNEEDISCFYYPPNPSIIKRYRANIAEQQVFYASGEHSTPFYEMAQDIAPGVTIAYMGVWGYKDLPEKVYMRNLFMGIDENQENNTASIMASGLQGFFKTILAKIPEVHRNNFIYAQTRYTELFTYEGDKFYHISSAIAHSTFVGALEQKANIPILTYPSVAKKKTGVNFAIRKDFADKHLYLKEVYKIRIKEFKDDNVKIDLLSRGTVVEGKVKWRHPHLNMEYTDSVFISPDSNPKNMRAINPDLNFTDGKGKMATVHDIMKQLNISENDLWDAFSRMTVGMEEKQELNALIPVPVASELYMENDISDEGRIEYVMVPVRLIFSYN